MKCHIVMQAMYISLLGFVFCPNVFFTDGNVEGSIYLVVALIPVIAQWTLFYSSLVCNMSAIETTGLLADKQKVSKTIRMQKTEKAIGIIMSLSKVGAQMDDDEPNYEPEDSHVKHEMREIAHMFDQIDRKGVGTLDMSGLKALMKSLGLNLTKEGEEIMIHKLLKKEPKECTITDRAGKKAVIHFCLQKRHTHPEDEHKETARKLFKLFDTDGSGSITAGEFKEGMDRFNSGLNEDEIFALVKDIDEEGTGEIDLEHFEKFIEECVEEGGHH